MFILRNVFNSKFYAVLLFLFFRMKEAMILSLFSLLAGVCTVTAQGLWIINVL